MSKKNVLIDKFRALETDAQTFFLERQEISHGLVLAALSGKHIFFVGPPGTAKSMLITWFCEAFGGEYFEWLLTQHSTPEEIFGPVDLGAYKQGVYRRITTGKLPEAIVCFLDEVFKADAAILNTLLKALGPERTFHNNGGATKIPLVFCAGASNELPADDAALGALYDRFLIRFHVGYLKERDSFTSLMNLPPKPGAPQTVSMEELHEAQEQVAAMPVAGDVAGAMADLRDSLQANGINASDRRFVQALAVMKAHAWLNGNDEVGTDAIEIGRHIFWDSPDDVRKVTGLCYQVSSPNMYHATKIFDAASDAAEKLLESIHADDGVDHTTEASTVASQLRRMRIELEALAGSKGGAITDMVGKVQTMLKEVVKKGIGFDVD